MINYIGIDPGSCSGCIAILTVNELNEIVFYYTIEFSKMTTKEWFKELKELTEGETNSVILEKVHGMPGMNVTAISSFMKNVGHIEMALLALNLPFKEVTPQSWMKHYGMKRKEGETKTEWKRRLRELLQRTLPGFNVTNDTADAMLIAYYAKESYDRA
jgi:Holliday junction resolvasome RuvABC endonuclease subunit